MIYAMSDIHGEYEKYRAMLEEIHFSPEDALYVLGDVVDRGPRPVEILRDMSMRGNVFPILGNHEAVAIHILEKLLVEITAENCETHLDGEWLRKIADWQWDGGTPTLEAFRALDNEARLDLLDYMRDFALYETVDVGERSFVLVHAGLRNFDEERPLRSYGADELLFDRHDFRRAHFADPNAFIVVGHTPTLALSGRAEIYQENNNICIDCGACYPNGRLACLCLDTMREYYV